MGEFQKLPLFPLNTVLFPGMLLPLHIFEPRYRLMIGRCIEANTPFGVVLIREGLEVGGEAEPYDIGTSAYVVSVDRLPDGRMNITTVGYQRFRIREIVEERPFKTALVEDHPLQGTENPAAEPVATRLSGLLRGYLDVLTSSANISLPSDQVPAGGAALAYFTAAVLPLSMADKQKLLATDDLLTLLRAELTLLRREKALLDYMVEQEQRRGGVDSFFSPN